MTQCILGEEEFTDTRIILSKKKQKRSCLDWEIDFQCSSSSSYNNNRKKINIRQQLSLSSKHLPKTSGDKAYGVCSINIKKLALWGKLARGAERCWRLFILSPLCFPRYGNQALLFMKLCLKMSFLLRY